MGRAPDPAEPVADPAARGVLTAKGLPHASEERRGGAASLRKSGLRAALKTAAEAHPGKRIALYFQDEMRVGQKGRLRHRWWSRGRRSPGVRQDQRFEWTCVFGAVRPDGEGAFGLVLPEVGPQATQAFLDAFAATIPDDEHALMVLDRAGWHGRQGPPGPAERQPRPAAAVFAPVQPDGAPLAVAARALPQSARVRGLRRHRRRLLSRLERRRRRSLPDPLPLPSAVDREGLWTGAPVQVHVSPRG